MSYLKSLAKAGVKELSPVLLPRNFTVPGLMFKSLTRFKLVFASDVGEGSGCILLHGLLDIPSSTHSRHGPLRLRVLGSFSNTSSSHTVVDF